MKTNLFDKKALAFFGTAAVLLAAVFTAGCKADVNDGGSKSDYATVPFGENGKDLKEYLQKLPDGSTVHKIEVTALKKEDLIGDSMAGKPSLLGKILKDNSTKKVALKLPKAIDGLTDMSHCFYGCTGITQVSELPTSVTNMSSCFAGCTGLTQTPTLPDAVKNISACFKGCTGLTQVSPLPASVTDMSFSFEGCTGLIQAPEIPPAVTDMKFSFEGCTGLVEAPKIPNTVKNMSGCFKGCTGITQAPAIPDSVTNMETCFQECTGLIQTPVIPSAVTNMGFCFYGCKKITTVRLKCNYGDKFLKTFDGCSGLTAGGIKVPSNQFDNYKNNANKMGTTPDKFAAE